MFLQNLLLFIQDYEEAQGPPSKVASAPTAPVEYTPPAFIAATEDNTLPTPPAHPPAEVPNFGIDLPAPPSGLPGRSIPEPPVDELEVRGAITHSQYFHVLCTCP